MTPSMKSIWKVRAFTYLGWSSKMGYSIAGMKFHYIDRDLKMKSFPIFILETEYMGKLVSDHKDIIRASIWKTTASGLIF